MENSQSIHMIHILKNGKRNISQRMEGVCKVYVCMYITMSMYYKRDYKKLFASLLGREHVHISATRGKNLFSTVLGDLVDAICIVY